MSSPPFVAASPAPIRVVAATFELTLEDKYLAVTVIFTLIILYFIAFSYYYKTRNNESESAIAAAGPLPALREPKIVKIEAMVFSYKEGRGSENDDYECVICLNQFKEGQKCRLMKKCGHRFHRSCIDRWLMVEQQCPLCRSCVCVVIKP